MTTKTTLILYASVDGQTLKICKFLVNCLQEKDEDVTLFEIDEFQGSLDDYGKIVIGCSIRYGVHHKSVLDFINKNQTALESHKTVFFSVNLVARKPEKNQADTNPYVIKFLKSITWKPSLVEVFAGMLDYQKYPYFDRIMIQFIMWMTKGPTDRNAKIEYTDWKRVEAFSDSIIKL
ncbi:menaquinone-dependent protoporphyrinogen IX dehydrogenase [Lutimonas sp.]|uniref:menaquinone-dependent protoporphyrinogen IX dehydrogenase n=1 Tax=Lutimonas sp. TaxID=1872403 RepID=UPI003D9AD45C